MMKYKKNCTWKKAAVYAFGILVIVLLSFLPARKVYAVPGTGEGGEEEACPSMTFDLLTPDQLLPGESAEEDAGGEALAGAAAAKTEKTLPLAVIVIGFGNLPYSDAYDWNDVIFSSQKSLAQYYRDMSFDKFTFVPVKESSVYGNNGNTNAADQKNDGVIHVKLKAKKTATWNGASRWQPANAKEEYNAFRNALIAAGKYLDFPSYDVNGNKSIETNELAVCFVVAGYDMAGGQEPETEADKYRFMWPYAFELSAFNAAYLENSMKAAEVNGIKINNYIAVGESMHLPEGDRREDMGTFAHELGHFLGLPDLYSLDSTGSWNEYNVRFLSLMASGTHGNAVGENWLPFSLDIWSRVQLGWVEPHLLGLSDNNYASDIAGSLTKNAKAPVALRIETNHVDEYYLVENRRFTGWDEDLGELYPNTAQQGKEDGGGGLLFWHIEEGKLSREGNVNGYSQHPGVMPLFKEKNTKEEWGTIGEEAFAGYAFFAPETWRDTMILPVYGQKENDTPADRKTTRLLTVSMDSSNGPTMRVHRHLLKTPTVHWEPSYAFAELWAQCEHCEKMVMVERSRNVTSKVLANATATVPGRKRFTVTFRTDDIAENRDITLPLVYGEAERLRQEAFQELTDVLKEAVLLADTASAYTKASWENYAAAAGAAQKVLKNAEATEKELRAAKKSVVAAKKKLVLAIDIREAAVEGPKPVTFTGKALTPKYVLTVNGKRLKEGQDYTITYKNNVHPGKASATIKGIGRYTGKFTKKFTIKKAANTLTVSAKTVSVSAKKLASAAVSVKRSNALTVDKAIGTLSYKLAKTSPTASAKYFTVAAGTGKLTVKKGTPKGTYKLKITVTAAGNADYVKSSKSAVVTVKVVA